MPRWPKSNGQNSKVDTCPYLPGSWLEQTSLNNSNQSYLANIKDHRAWGSVFLVVAAAKGITRPNRLTHDLAAPNEVSLSKRRLVRKAVEDTESYCPRHRTAAVAYGRVHWAKSVPGVLEEVVLRLEGCSSWM